MRHIRERANICGAVPFMTGKRAFHLEVLTTIVRDDCAFGPLFDKGTGSRFLRCYDRRGVLSCELAIDGGNARSQPGELGMKL